MELLVFRALITALLVGTTSVVQARCGPKATGWLVGLPLTSLPFLLFVGIGEGAWMARSTAAGIVIGQVTAVACCAVYAYVARHRGWVAASCAAGAVAVCAGGGLVAWHLPWWCAVLLLGAFLAGTLACWPQIRSTSRTGHQRWKRDAFFRTAVATACVVVATKASGAFGPEVAGALVAFPTVPLIHAAFTQRATGTAASVQLIESMLTGMWCGGTFVLLVAAFAGPLDVLPSCAIAIGGAAIVRAVAAPLTRALTRLRLAARLRYRWRLLVRVS
ncbi:MAG: hypothetical protein GEV07_01545 [Streptosporangiales bacterium]|nr:hypothetical protein [Streptosporangiales bacterium]